jgi:phospholipase C
MQKSGRSCTSLLLLGILLFLHVPVATCAAQTKSGLSKIKHIIIIVQENHSFDNYFGTFPGADGIPMKNGKPTVCVPDPNRGACVAPFHDPSPVNIDMPHGYADTLADIAGGKMNGFIAQAESYQVSCTTPKNPECGPFVTNVMGWYDARDIPNYWSWAKDYVLHDHLFAPSYSWSLVSHLFLVSGWSAKCTRHNDPSSCVNKSDTPDTPPDWVSSKGVSPIYAWTDITYLMHRHKVSWGYYIQTGISDECEHDEMDCPPVKQSAKTGGIWNPLLWFDTVKVNRQLGNIQPSGNFFIEARKGTLPAVSFIVPSMENSEHPPSNIQVGQAYVTNIVNAVMKSPNWSSSAIFVVWDDWGGYYDHVVPPTVDVNGYGIRIPGLIISPYAKKGYIDHQTLSLDAYAKFIEDVFIGGQRLDPKTDGRPDPRPTVRENVKILGDLANDFDFTQKPRAPKPLALHPAPGPASVPDP